MSNPGGHRRPLRSRWAASHLAAVIVVASALVPAVAAPTHADVAPLSGLLSNLTRQFQRQAEYSTPAYQERLRAESTTGFASAIATLKADPERNFTTDLCWSKASVLSPCLGDVRLYDWSKNGYGLSQPVLFTNRAGATISGHVFATKAGPAKRPGIVITPGSLQATEQMYWWAAQTLAKAGYVVLVTDPQNQGMSDTFGEGKDLLSGTLSQASGDTYTYGTQDALDFLLATPTKPYCPRLSPSGRSHCAKQKRRVSEGFDAAYNPYWKLVDPTHIGLAGHSAGAFGVSYIGQLDKRVDAVVAWDNMCVPSSCLIQPAGPDPAPRVPTLGVSEDYLGALAPNPISALGASRAYSKAGVDSGQIVINGGTHFEYSYIPFPVFSATLRGIDLTSWYTTAWFDRYLRTDPTADARLLTTRWTHDAQDAKADPANQGNMFSFLLRSRLAFHKRSGAFFSCENLRATCAGQVANDGQRAGYSFLKVATTRDDP